MNDNEIVDSGSQGYTKNIGVKNMAGQKNLKKVNKNLHNVKLENFQLIENEKHDNYIKLQYGGFELPISQMSGKDVLDLLADLYEAKTDAEVQALMCGKSLASLKIVEAHGRTIVESQKHYIEQKFTYADSFKGVMNFEGKSLQACLNEFKEITESDFHNTVEDWLIRLSHFYENKTISEIHEIAKYLVSSNNIHIVNNYIYSHDAMHNFVKIWSSENGKMMPSEEIEKTLDKIFKIKRA